METWEWTIARDYRDRLAGTRRCVKFVFVLCTVISVFLLRIQVPSCIILCFYSSRHLCRTRRTDTAAYLLEKALQVEEADPLPLVEAIYWLESAYLIEQVNATQLRAIRAPLSSADSAGAVGTVGGVSGVSGVRALSDSVSKLITSSLTDVADHQGSGAVHTPAHLLKNTGLAYVHLVRNTALAGTLLPLPQRDVLRTLESGLLPWPISEK